MLALRSVKETRSIGDPCIALCKGFLKGCAMLQAEIWKTFRVKCSKACFDSCNKQVISGKNDLNWRKGSREIRTHSELSHAAACSV